MSRLKLVAKFIKACLLLLSLSASSPVVAITDLGSFSESLNPPSSFNLGSLKNDSYFWLGSVTENGNFTHPYNFPRISDKGGVMVGRPFDYPSNIYLGLGHLILSSQVNNSALEFFDNDNTSKGETSLTSISFSSPLSGNHTLNITGHSARTISDNYGKSMIVSVEPEPERWIIMGVVFLFLGGMQVIKDKRIAEPFVLKAS